MKISNFYASSETKRLSEFRRDSGWIEAKLVSPQSYFLPIWQSHNFLNTKTSPPTPVLIPTTSKLLSRCEEPIFLGLRNNNAYFTANVISCEKLHFTEFGAFCDLREIGPVLPGEDAALLAYARAMTTWQSRHKFCGRCGSPNVTKEAGHVLACTNSDCGFLNFPRTDPAVIMLIHDGHDRCILGRQKSWRPGQFSVLAGFVEPGESLEDAVAREIFEEVGIGIDEIEYHSSQPWPFPSSIMLGFRGRAAEANLTVDTFELETARWFNRDEILSCPENNEFRLPRVDSISRRLIEDWVKGI